MFLNKFYDGDLKMHEEEGENIPVSAYYSILFQLFFNMGNKKKKLLFIKK